MTTAVEYPNWFKVTGETSFEKHLAPLAGEPDLRFLQIGAFTGEASVWLLDNVLTGDRCLLLDVDTWAGSDEDAHRAFDWADVERLYDQRTAGRWVRKVKSTSEAFFAALTTWETFDFIYIDAAHDEHAVAADAVSAFGVLNVGGLLAFDDYNWTGVGRAVDKFADAYGPSLERLEIGAQAWFRRIA